MRRGKIRKIIVLTFCVIGLFCCIAYIALFLLLQSPASLKYLASVFGYEVSARAMSFSPGLSGRIEDLIIKNASSGLTVVCSSVTMKNSLDMLLTGQIESLEIRNPRLTFRSSAGKSDLSFLKKLPDVRLLDIQNAEIDYLAGKEQEVKLTDFNLMVKDFSPKKGGHISLRANFSYTSRADTGVSAKGKIAAMVQLAGIYPIPYGQGSIDFTVDSGKYLSGNRTISLNDLSLVTKLVYDRRTETFTVDSMTGKSRELGAIKVAAKAVMTSSMPWSLNLSVSSTDFSKVFGVVRPFLNKDLKGWTVKGKGGVETALQGTYADKQPSFSGTVSLSFKETGAGSPDGSISAQGASGTVVLKMKYSSPEQKLAFNLSSVQRHGEQLWKAYYNDLKGQQASVTADGTVTLTRDLPFSVIAKLDIFQTGEYSVSMSGNRHDWSMKVMAANVSHEKVIEKMLKEYLNSSASGLKGFSATGFSSLETVIRRNGGATYVSGVYTMTDTAINAPDLQLSVRTISVDLPFDLVHPSSAWEKPVSRVPGSIRFTDIQRKRLSLGDLYIPVVIARNMLEVPERVVIPFYSGKIEIYDVMADDLLSPDMQVRFGLKLENINLGSLTEKLLDVELPGAINADFGVMSYQNNRLMSKGTAVINVFGGEIKAANFFAQDITLPSRKFGGDITFKDINLEEMTGKIAIGRMSGDIRGSLKGFTMEYGQPSGFILEVESVKKAGITQQISSDAINNISILGAGAGSVLGKGITKYFKNFPYSKIGFRCMLKNDQFAINGTILEGDKEYLVRKGLFRGVDVINQNRNNVISFRDMEERIKRISRPAEAKSGKMLVQ
jgi:hypothetical protein